MLPRGEAQRRWRRLWGAWGRCPWDINLLCPFHPHTDYKRGWCFCTLVTRKLATPMKKLVDVEVVLHVVTENSATPGMVTPDIEVQVA